ncbi:hypothetical protein ACXX82_00225 [Glaciimonas sp. GNP009]
MRMQLTAILLATLLLPELSHAAKKNQNPTAFESQGFNDEVDKFPENYQGTNVGLMLPILKKISDTAERSEFETTNTYNDRLVKITHAPLYGSVSTDSNVAIVLNIKEYGIQYDADSQSVRVRVDPAGVATKLFSLRSESASNGTYIGANGFNRKIIVDKIKRWDTNISMQGVDRYRSTTLEFPYVKIQHIDNINECKNACESMAVMYAQKAKKNVRVLVVGKLAFPYFDEGCLRETPTIDSPYDVQRCSKNIRIEPTSFWIFNQQDGTIYAKFPIDDILVNNDISLRRK